MQFKTFSELEKDNLELLSLVDGVTEVVELFKPESPAQGQWKKDWLERSRKIINEYVTNKTKGE